MMAAESSRHSGLLGTIPRSRQISARTAPAGRRRISAAMSPGVGRRAMRGSPAAALPSSGWAARGWRSDGAVRCRCGRLADGVADQPGLERGGAKQAAGDARDDFSDVDGAEVPRDVGEVGRGGALLQRGGHVPAVGDQRADEGEEAPGAAGCVGADGRPILVGIGAVGWAGSGGRGGHGGSKTIFGGDMSRNIFLIIPLT